MEIIRSEEEESEDTEAEDPLTTIDNLLGLVKLIEREMNEDENPDQEE